MPPVHEFLLKSPGARVAPVSVVLELRDALDSLPPTAATWMPTDYVNHQTLKPEMVELVGAWRVPDVYPATGGSGAKYVNPDYSSPGLYTDVTSRCECGAVLTRQRLTDGEEHSDDCRRQWRHRARAALFERQREVLLTCYDLGMRHHEMKPRLGLSDRMRVSEEAREVGIELEAERETGRQRRADTMAALLTSYSTVEVARVYGISDNAVRELVERRTEYDAGQMYEFRRKSGRA